MYATHKVIRRICQASCSMSVRHRFSSSLSKNLKVKMVIFDADVLVVDPKLDPVKANALKKEEKEKKEREQKEKSKGELLKGVEGLSDVKDKYMLKLRNRLGAAASVDVVDTGGGGRGAGNKRLEGLLKRKKNSDASTIHAASQNLARGKGNYNGVENVGSQAASQWLWRPGMASVVDYVRFRSLRLGLLLGSTNNFVQETLKQQLKDITFESLGDDSLSGFFQRMSDKESEDNYAVPSDVLLISRSDEILSLGRDLGLYTCRFRREGDRAGQVYTHYKAHNAIEVQDALEDLCGIAMRASAFASRVHK
jgi:hypothetical protein